MTRLQHALISFSICAFIVPILSACSGANSDPKIEVPDTRPPIIIEDLTDDFLAFYAQAEGLDMPAQITLFEERVAPLFPEFYFQDGMNTKTRHAWYALGFSTFPDLADDFETKSNYLAEEIRPIIDDFAAKFPEYGRSTPARPVALVNSLGLFRVRSRSFKGREYFMIGVDGMAAFHDWDDEAPFIHHELFHVYHQSRFKDCAELWCYLWSEGLATLVSEDLSPDASDQALMLDNPLGTVAKVDANLAIALESLEAEFEVAHSNLYRALFLQGDSSNAFPERYGYYLGYRIMSEAALSHDIHDLAEIPPVIAKPIIIQAYADLLEKARRGDGS